MKKRKVMKMSVVRFTQEEWNRIYTSLLRFETAGDIRMFEREQIVEVMEVYKVTEAAARKALLKWFIAKLAGINQLTYCYQYRIPQSAFDFITPTESKETMGREELEELLGLVEYNCIDNNGTKFLPALVEEKLSDIKKQISSNSRKARIR